MEKKLKISVVTPSYNQARFVSRTLDSVAMQRDADYEHIIFDGLSTDGSHEVIRRYAEENPRVMYRHEADRGQMHAINKGFAVATGDIIAWINSDDYYFSPDVFSTVVAYFEENPGVDIVYGRGYRVDADGKRLSEAYIHPDGSDLAVELQRSLGILQPSVFFRRRVYDEIGGLNENYNLQLDYEYWIRMVKRGFKFGRLDKHLSNATVHKDAKSTGQRQAQLNECISLVKFEFGYVPMEWISRYAEFYLTNQDAKVEKNIALDDEQKRKRRIIEMALARKYNSDAAAIAVLAGTDSAPACNVRTFLAKEGVLVNRRVVVTSFDSQYFNQGMNLIASLQRTSFDTIDEILVYALGLESAEMATLNSIDKVRVVAFPSEAADIFPGYLEPKHRAYKPWAIRAREHVREGDLLLWMDAGLSALQDISVIFELIARDDFFIADHDDKKSWPFYNVNFMHWTAQDAFGPSNEELLAPQMCSCMVGHKVGGRFQRLIDEAFEYGCNPDIVLWPKSIPMREKYRPHLSEKEIEVRNRLLSDPASANELSREAIRQLFPYYGHRTQSIYSILVQRFGAPRSSGNIFRRSSDLSSKVSMRNWENGARSTGVASSRLNLQGQDESVVVYHHRGVYDNLNGLRYRRSGEHLFLMGNGPSLKDAPFDELKKHATLGMNAAYRFWDETGFYPTYYCCLDAVVMESHKDEIYRLIRERRKNGIRKFFLREGMIEYFPDLDGIPDVFFLERVAKSNNLLALDKITTGSFSLLFAVMLGYRNVYVMGVDLNYVEKLPEATANGRILEISEDPEDNPNYFFAGYQRKGDKYNPPNRHPNMHVRSWENIKSVLGEFPVRVLNLNPASALKCFEFAEIESVLKEISAPNRAVQEVADAAIREDAEKRFWREQLLNELQRSHSQAEALSPVGVKRDALEEKPLLIGFGTVATLLDDGAPGDWHIEAEGGWRLEAGEAFKHTFGLKVRGPTTGRELVASMRVVSDSALTLAVHLSRKGGGEYEGARVRIKLIPGQETVIRVRKRFESDHRWLRLNIAINEIDKGIKLKIGRPIVFETIGSLRTHGNGRLPDFSKANTLYREGEYGTALLAYMTLHHARGLAMYGQNALMCANKLSLHAVETTDDILGYCQ